MSAFSFWSLRQRLSWNSFTALARGRGVHVVKKTLWTLSNYGSKRANSSFCSKDPINSSRYQRAKHTYIYYAGNNYIIFFDGISSLTHKSWMDMNFEISRPYRCCGPRLHACLSPHRLVMPLSSFICASIQKLSICQKIYSSFSESLPSVLD